MWTYVYKIVDGKVVYLSSVPRDLCEFLFYNRIKNLKTIHDIKDGDTNACICWSTRPIQGAFC